jgi:N-acetylglucosamine transport system permease protein
MDSIMKALGLDSWIRVWLGDKGVILPALTVIMVWSQIGFNMILFLSGILNIPKSLYEAAEIDGAGEIYITFKVTIPLIWEIVRTALIFFIITAFTFYFQIIMLVTRGGPDRASEVLGTYLYEKSFGSHQFGYGTTIGVVLFAITMILVLIVMKGTEKEVNEY